MSDLFTQLTRLYTGGLTRPAPALWPDPRTRAIAQFKPAAVLVAITDRPKPGLLLIHRPETMRAHPGQVAFPGGRIDPGEDAITAACREAEEELALPRAAVRVIGASDSYRTGSGYEITPIIALVPPDLPLCPNPAEVADWFEAPLDFVLNPANHQPRDITVDSVQRRFIEMDFQGHRIWGVTAAILANLAARLDWCGACAHDGADD